MKRWIGFAAFVLVLNFAWEMSQASWFANMREMPFWRATRVCFIAAVGDLIIAAIAFGLAALIARRAAWPLGPRAPLSTIVFILVGFVIVVAYEWAALKVGRWRYAETMPLLFGIGVLPLAQWLVLPIVEVLLFRMMGVDAR